MKTVLIIAISEISAGELNIAYEFIKRLDKNIFKLGLIFNKKYQHLVPMDENINLLMISSEESNVFNRNKIISYFNEFSVDYFILSDPFTIEYSYPWSGIRFKDVKKYNVPIIALDEYDYTNAGYSLDYYGGLVQRLPNLVEQCDYVIKDCPINHGEDNEREYHFSLYNGFKSEKYNKCELRLKYHFKEEQKIIFYVDSSWENINAHNIGALTKLTNQKPFLLQNYIRDIGEEITIIHIGNKKWDVIVNEKLNYIYYENVPEKIFNELLQLSDIFFTFNIVSITLSKAVYMEIPSIVFTNDKILNFSNLQRKLLQLPDWYREIANDIKMVYPFKASSFGWNKFLSCVLCGNPYLETFIMVQAFKYDEVIKRINNLLFNEQEIRSIVEKCKQYKESLKSLKTPNEILCLIDRSINGSK